MKELAAASVVPLSKNILEVWDEVMGQVSSAMEGTSSAGGGGIQHVLHGGIDDVLAQFASESRTATRARAHEMSRQLGIFLNRGSIPLAVGQRRRVSNLNVALADFAQGNADSVRIDETTVQDSPLDLLGLPEFDASVAAIAERAFHLHMNQGLDRRRWGSDGSIARHGPDGGFFGA